MSSENQDKQTTFSPSIVSALLEGLKNQKETSEFSDAQVVIDNFEFKCHRVILAAYSGFFKAIFTSGMKEDLERKVTLKEISRETFADVLDCMYTGKNIISESSMFEVWHAANLLQILCLIHECELFLQQKISTENCLAIYQHSKLLDSKEMIAFSWSYIVQHFESVRRCEEILMITEVEMETLFASPDLKTNSEDDVLETILLWVAYTPTEYLDETREIAQTWKNDTPGHSQNEDTLAEDGSKVSQDQDISTATDKKIYGYAQKQIACSRADHLSNLLKLTRVSLLSGKCLIEAMNKDIVRADKTAQEILQNGLEYILRTDRQHDFCPTSAIHRSLSHLENVTVAVQKHNNADVLVCRRQNGQWCGLGNHLGQWYVSTSITCFNNAIYLATSDRRMHVYTTCSNTWKEFQNVTSKEIARCLLSIGNFLYAVLPKNESFSIEMINVVQQRKWINVCCLSSELSCINCYTVIGDIIVFFGSVTGKSETQVVIFDTATLRCFPLNATPSIPSPTVCFSNGKDSFVLQKNGSLYRIKTCSEAPFIEIMYETMLWDFDRDITGAVLFDDELLLFGPDFSTSDTDKKWELSIPGVFKCIKNITCDDSYSCFMHAVIPKQYLSRIISVY